MYKLLLADDEGIVIDSLKFIIEKEFGNECMVEFAKTGRSVIELAESFRPDIAVMDIQMPGINGIDAMKEIRRTNGSVVFIVMSAYDKFDYAKEAIKIGVTEYISKPMDRKKIVASLRNAMDIVDEQRQKRSNDLLIKEKLETVVPILENGLIYNILFKEHFAQDMENYENLLNIDTRYAYMFTIVCGEGREGSHMTNAVGSSVRLQKHYPEIRNTVKETFDCIVGTVMSNKLVVLVKHPNSTMDYNERIELIDKTRDLVRHLRRQAEIDIRIGIGGVKSIDCVRDSYEEAVHALLADSCSVAHADELAVRCGFEENYPIDLEKKLFACIENGEVNETRDLGNDYFRWFSTEYKDSLMDTRLKILELAMRAETLAYVAGGRTYHVADRRDYLPSVMGTEDPEELQHWFLEKLVEAAGIIRSKKTDRGSSVIEHAKKYIDSHYAKDISLDDVSRYVDISPYYFSKLFKENVGEGFLEYLTNLRIEKAKELLGKPEISIKEVCSMVGYADPNYFSRTFKKNTGVTPTEFKEGKGE